MEDASIALETIVIDERVQIRKTIEEDTIRKYADSFEKLPPIVIFETPGGLILADGFHRCGAARRLGRNAIRAQVRSGTWNDAAMFSVTANTSNGRGLTVSERDEGIRRLKKLNPALSLRDLAGLVSVGYQTVRRVLEIDRVKRSTGGVTRVTDSHYREVAGAPEKYQTKLLKMAESQRLSRDALGKIVKILRDSKVPDSEKATLFREGGKLEQIAPQEKRRVRVKNFAIALLEGALSELKRARFFHVDTFVDLADEASLAQWRTEIPGNIEFLRKLLEQVALRANSCKGLRTEAGARHE
jgi:ParB-like chromosome segregation protein Spo0J